MGTPSPRVDAGRALDSALRLVREAEADALDRVGAELAQAQAAVILAQGREGSASASLDVGTLVLLTGLSSEPLNGCCGRVSGEWTGERYPIDVWHVEALVDRMVQAVPTAIPELEPNGGCG